MAAKKETDWFDVKEIEDQLASEGWRDDTLSPLTQRHYWRLVADLVKRDEKIRSILFAKSLPTRLIQKQFVFVVTDEHIIWRSNSGGYISNPRIMQFDALKDVELSEDIFLPNSIFIDFILKKQHNIFNVTKKISLQTFDQTGVQHFKRAIYKLQKREDIPN